MCGLLVRDRRREEVLVGTTGLRGWSLAGGTGQTEAKRAENAKDSGCVQGGPVGARERHRATTGRGARETAGRGEWRAGRLTTGGTGR